MTTAEKLSAALAQRSWTPAQLAEKVGAQRSTVHGWLHGVGPKFATLLEVAKTLELPFTELLGDEPNEVSEVILKARRRAKRKAKRAERKNARRGQVGAA